MSNSSRAEFHSRSNPLDDDSQEIPAWIYALAIGVITLIVILR